MAAEGPRGSQGRVLVLLSFPVWTSALLSPGTVNPQPGCQESSSCDCYPDMGPRVCFKAQWWLTQGGRSGEELRSWAGVLPPTALLSVQAVLGLASSQAGGRTDGQGTGSTPGQGVSEVELMGTGGVSSILLHVWVKTSSYKCTYLCLPAGLVWCLTVAKLKWISEYKYDFYIISFYSSIFPGTCCT